MRMSCFRIAAIPLASLAGATPLAAHIVSRRAFDGIAVTLGLSF